MAPIYYLLESELSLDEQPYKDLQPRNGKPGDYLDQNN